MSKEISNPWALLDASHFCSVQSAVYNSAVYVPMLVPTSLVSAIESFWSYIMIFLLSHSENTKHYGIFSPLSLPLSLSLCFYLFIILNLISVVRL